MNILQNKKNHLFVSRAATAIYLILKNENIRGKNILYPANICYAAIYPALYSDNIPLFCDVNSTTGNVTYNIIEKFIDEVSAMVLPHMYGNPIQDIDRIRELCDQKGILLIEDCASSMGATVAGKQCGEWGHYSIYSTGYSKTIDIGKGGILLTDKKIDKIRAMYEELPLRNENIDNNETFFSKLYRLIRNMPEQDLEQYIWNGFRNNLKDMFIYRDPVIDGLMEEALLKLDDVIIQRRREAALYEVLLAKSDLYRKYDFQETAVPWRFCLLVRRNEKKPLIDYLLEKNVPVSDWYPVVTPIFGVNGHYEGANKMEEEIINFPLMIGEQEVRRICGHLNNYVAEHYKEKQ